MAGEAIEQDSPQGRTKTAIILANIRIGVAVKILAEIQTLRATDILDKMPPEKAEAILTKGIKSQPSKFTQIQRMSALRSR